MMASDIPLVPVGDRVHVSRSTLSLVDIIPHRQSPVRFGVLFLCAVMMFGSYYFFDQCSASQDAVVAQLKISENEFGLLQSIYSWPNTVLPLFGGLLIDRVGIRKSMILFICLCFFGQMIYSFSLKGSSYWGCVAGRFVFGLGGESLSVSALALVAMWFKGKELAFAMGMIICVSRLGSVAAFNSQAQIIARDNVTDASFLGLVIMGISVGAGTSVAYFDKRADKIDVRNGVRAISAENVTQSAEESFSFRTMKKLGPMYWLITFSCVTVYISAFPFFQVTSGSYLQTNFEFSAETANFITSLPNLVSAFTSPVLGLVVDRMGKRPYFMIASTVAFMGCFSAFCFYGVCPMCWSVVVVYVFIGCALCLFGAVMWPCIPLVIDEKLVGTAFGLTTAVQNLGLAIAPILFTTLKTASEGSFIPTFLTVIISNFLACLASLYLWRLDNLSGGKLMAGEVPEDKEVLNQS